MKNEMNQSGSKNKFQAASIVLAVLFVCAATAAIWLIGEKNKEARQRQDLSSQLEEVNVLKTQQEVELSQLRGDIEGQIAANDTLNLELETRLSEIENLKFRVHKARKQLAEGKRNSDAIREKLAKLEELKLALENDILVLKDQNVALKSTNDALETTLEEKEQDISLLNDRIAAMTQDNQELKRRLYTIAPAGFKAENFMITAEKRNDKITTKANRADEIKITFDIDNVPAELHGEREIYLVLTKFNGSELQNVSTRSVKVQGSDKPMNVSAADVEKLNLKDRQQVTMSFRPDSDLEPGNYNVLVYADNGFLGSTGLSLR